MKFHHTTTREFCSWVITFEIEGTFTAGCAAKTYGPPEYCYPAEPGEIEIEGVTIEEICTGDKIYTGANDEESAFMKRCELLLMRRINSDDKLMELLIEEIDEKLAGDNYDFED